ncbi:TIGR01212 family radical SAM protein [Bdellovibrio reynosensis]|uniref:TIGR01212 family radical SAM protein n=1 Tax=Bdellovibrio reynosensis TaxID=2835041 RepID=A0ABY4CEQ0_9BACT|nr:TIGR01212 family radical SAM protein [Bdellovibrio reynosensis]UOF02023.1 TIGR01212 family radical SAM protein [Bdellovibrio reynosensis]
MEKGWLGLPYHTISEHYNKLFGEKVYKVPVSVVDDCPNRRGLKGMQTCVFCDVWGSAANAESLSMELRTQIEKYQTQIGDRYKAKAFLIYFQAYTNTFTKVSALRHNFDVALSYPWVKGFTLGTRPDCLSKAVLDLWQEYHERSFVAVELGVQSFFNDQLEFMRRGHTAEASIEAVHKIANSTKVDLGIHLIFGNPGETDEHIIKTAEIVNTLPITNVKLHNLHVLKQTPLEEMYAKGEFTPIDRETYAHRVEVFLKHLSPKFAMHRLAAYSSRWDELIAPEWTKDKMGTHQYIIDHLRAQKAYQSQNFVATTAEDIAAQSYLQKKSVPLSPNLV